MRLLFEQVKSATRRGGRGQVDKAMKRHQQQKIRRSLKANKNWLSLLMRNLDSLLLLLKFHSLKTKV